MLIVRHFFLGISTEHLLLPQARVCALSRSDHAFNELEGVFHLLSAFIE